MADVFDEAVQFAAGNISVTFDVDGFDLTAVIDDVAEDFEVRILDKFCNVGELHVEAQVRLIRAVVCHGVVPSHAMNRELDVVAQRFFEDVVYHLFDEGQDFFLVHEGHFHVELSKFRLAVGAQVFIAEAAGDLVITVHTGNHEQLFKNLRRLRQRIEFAFVDTARYEVVTSAFWRALAEFRRFNVDEAVFVEERAHGMFYFMAHDEVVLHFRTAQVEVAVFEADLFVDVDVVFNVERRRLGRIEDAQFFAADFDSARLHLGVDRIFITHADDAAYSQDVFCTYLFCFIERNLFIIRRSDDLYDARTVAEIDEDQSAVVAAAFYPAGQDNFFAVVRFTYFSAVLGAV